MRNLLLMVCMGILMGIPFAVGAQTKQAIMLAAFGTSTEAAVTFDRLVPLVKAQYPGRDIVVPFTSSIIRNKLNAEIENPADKILSPEEMLNRLKSQGYTDIAVVSTILFPGVEHDKLKATVDKFAAENKNINVSYTLPILGDEKNLQPVVNTLKKYMITDGINVVVSHGTHEGHPVEATYLKLAEVVNKTYPNAYVGSIEGEPDMEEVLGIVEESGADNVRFVVFMFVAGDHAENDIAGDEEDSLFTEVEEMGKIPSVAYKNVDGTERIVSLGLDDEYLGILLAHYKNNVK